MIKRPPKSVAIVAMGRSAASYMQLATMFGDRRLIADETWAINSMGGVLDHDLLFAMDDLRIQEERAREKPNGSVAGSLRWLTKHPRFFTSRAYPDEYPGGMEFPLKEVSDCLNLCYFNSTVAYAIGYAIYLGVKEIGLFGVDFTYPDAHIAEKGRGCVEFLLGVAHERGIVTRLPRDTTLLDTCVPATEKPYGYDTEDVKITKDPEQGFIISRTPREITPSAAEMDSRYRKVVALGGTQRG